MDLLVVRIRERNYEGVPLAGMVAEIMTDTGEDREIEALHLDVAPRVIGCVVLVPWADYSVRFLKELGRELSGVVVLYCGGHTVCEHAMVHESLSD